MGNGISRRMNTYDILKVTVLAYDGFGGMSKYLDEGWGTEVVRIDKGVPVDREQLITEMVQATGGQPFYVRDTTRWGSWGADAPTILEIVLHVSAIAGGLAGVVAIGDTVRKWRQERQEPLDGETATSRARNWLGECLSVEADALQVKGVEPMAGGFRVTLSSHVGDFDVEVTEEGVYRLKKRRSRGSEPPGSDSDAQ